MIGRRGLLGGLGAGALVGGPAQAAGVTTIVPFDTTPFPYDGLIPDQDKPFLDVVGPGGRRGHTAPRNGIRWEDESYSDRNVLLSIPPNFEPRRPAFLVVFFHGNRALLARDVVARQGIARQLASSGLNGVLVAPQFAHDASDSSAGRFWQPDVFSAFLEEAAERLAALPGSGGCASFFAGLPVVLCAYSGGYLPAAFSLSVGGADARLHGLVLFDALYGEIDRFGDWIRRQSEASFVLVAYGDSSRPGTLMLLRQLDEAGLTHETRLLARLEPGRRIVLAAGRAPHNDFMTHAWTNDPLAAVLSRLG